jgi:hypothetical protein
MKTNKYNEKRVAHVADIGLPHTRSSFGDHMSDSLEPVEQISAQYGITFDNLEIYSATGGTVTESENMFVCSTGTSIGGYGVLRTKRPTIYREGQGLMARFTALFDSNAVANSLQFAGLFNVQDTIAFGYRGADFGILFDNYGAQDLHDFDITTSGNGTLELTLNSVLYSIPITTGTEEHNAYEIEAWINANQSVWTAEQVNKKVILRANNVGAKGGTYSIGGASGLAGTITLITSGTAQTKTTILQEDWNGEKVVFDKTKGNVYMIKVSYLGFGPISFFIMDSESGIFKRVHTIKYQNNYTKPSLSNRALKVGWTAASLGSTTDLTVKGASAGTFIEGISKKTVLSHAQSNENTSVGNSFEAVLTLKALESLNGKAMLGRVILRRLIVSTDASKEVVVKMCKNATIGETDYTYHEEGESVLIYDVGDHADTGNAHALYETQVGGGGDREVNLKDLNIEFYANDYITIFAKVVSGAAANVTASIVWTEDI